MGIVTIPTTLLSRSELGSRVDETTRTFSIPPPSGLRAKARWIQCTIKNATQFPITYQGSHFDSGRYWTIPGGIAPFEVKAFSGCNGDGTLFTGVSGGNAFTVDLGGNVKWDFALGWTNPYAGASKVAVIQSNSAEAGYNAASREGNSVTSALSYTGKDKDGEEFVFHFHISAAVGESAATVVITQVVE